MKNIFLFGLCLGLLNACGRNLDSGTYVSSDTVGKVVRGTIVHVEAVTIRDQDDPNQAALGGLGGGALGGAAGSGVGDGSGQAVAAIGGAIAGAVIGSLIEQELSTQQGYQYVVALAGAPARFQDGKTYRETDFRARRGGSIENDVKESIRTEQQQSEMISVVQADDKPLRPGQRVLVIYHDDRPRIVPERTY